MLSLGGRTASSSRSSSHLTENLSSILQITSWMVSPRVGSIKFQYFFPSPNSSRTRVPAIRVSVSTGNSRAAPHGFQQRSWLSNPTAPTGMSQEHAVKFYCSEHEVDGVISHDYFQSLMGIFVTVKLI